MIRALFFDVDGTLVSFSTHRIPESTLRALGEAHARGIRIFIATGRASTDLEPVREIPYDGVVALNGADCVLRDGERIARQTIPCEEVERALELGERYGFAVAFEQNEGLFVDRLTPAVEAWAELVNHPLPQVVDLRAHYRQWGCSLMCFFLDPAAEEEVMAQLPALEAARWCPLFVDVNLRGVNKASGLRLLGERFGFAAEETMAFGDGGNDVAMLRAAGIGVAMGNACEEARAAADWITSSVDDDGICRALERFGVIGAPQD